MWLSLWRSIDRFSLQHVIDELRGIKVVDQHNKEVVVDLLQCIVEIVTYGDNQDPKIFQCLMENQVLAEFVRVLKISNNSWIEATLLQYLSIMIQNLDSEHAIYYCFSNDYINNIISHQFDFNQGDLALSYVSFLRAVSNKLNRDTLCLLIKVHGALKFASHEEKMIQTTVRSLALSIYYVSDDMVYQYITTPPVSKYFSDLVLRLREQCFHLDVLVHASEDICIHRKRKQLLLQVDKIVDDLYYFKEILDVGDYRASGLVPENLLSLLVFPMLNPLLTLKQAVTNLSAVTSLYLVSRLRQVVGGKGIVNPVAGVVLCPHMTSSIREAIRRNTAEGNSMSNSFSGNLCIMDEMGYLGAEFEEESASSPQDNVCVKRSGISRFIFSENHSLVLASLFLLLTLAESKDLDCVMLPIIGFDGMHEADENIFLRFTDQILNALLKVLASKASISALINSHSAWLLQKLLTVRGKRLDDHNLQLFSTSYEQSCQQLEKELDGCWFDHILDTLRTEWTSCKTALEESCKRKDPFFTLEVAVAQETSYDDTNSYVAWQRMVDTVKVFILHLQLKSCMCRGRLLDHPLLNTMHGPAAGPSQTHASEVSSASFGSEVSIGIAFSKAGSRVVYASSVATGISGKLLLAEKHPFCSHRGVVLAMAPLAGLSPKIDDVHPMRLHLRIKGV